MGPRITTGRRDSLRFKAVIFMHPCIYHTASCKRKTAPANKVQPERDGKQSGSRESCYHKTGSDRWRNKKRTKLVLAATY